MLKKLLEKWNLNKDALKEELRTRDDLNAFTYSDLVKLTFDIIYNRGEEESLTNMLATEGITRIDDGDYQGTLLFVIPFRTYQPTECEYLMTYVGYGSCSGCDTLLALQGCGWDKQPLDNNQVNGFMQLCKDIICNTIKPYNHGWRRDKDFEPVDDTI